MKTLYEINILNQPTEWKRLLITPLPLDLNTLHSKRVIFVGIGSSYWAARFAEFLLEREHHTNADNIDPLSVEF